MVHNWDTKFNITSTNTTANVDDDGSRCILWFWCRRFNFENLKLKIGYSVYNMDDDVESINVGLTYKISY